MHFPLKYLKLIFESLSDDSLLLKCLHGKTQNQNESFNGLIWRRTPKDRFVKMATFELAVYDAAAHFNIGNLASLLVYDNVNIERGYYTIQGCIVDNNLRIKKMLSDKLVIVPKLIDCTSVEGKKAKLIIQKHQRVKFTLLETFNVCIMYYIYIYMNLCFYYCVIVLFRYPFFKL